jgi:hypothetical protein
MNENLAQDVAQNTRDIAVLQEHDKSFDQRLTLVEKMVDVTHKLVTNVEALTIEVKHLSESIKNQESMFENRLKSQGERIGALEGKPGKKWDAVVDKALMLVVGAVVAFMLTKLGL